MTDQLGDGPIESGYERMMNAVARALDQAFNGDAAGGLDRTTGFVLLTFPYGTDEGRCNYISNGLPLEADVAASVLRVLGLTYPNAVMGSPGPDDKEMVLLIPQADRDPDQSQRLVTALTEAIKDCANYAEPWGDECLTVDSDLDMRDLAEAVIEHLSVAKRNTPTGEEPGAVEMADEIEAVADFITPTEVAGEGAADGDGA